VTPTIGGVLAQASVQTPHTLLGCDLCQREPFTNSIDKITSQSKQFKFNHILDNIGDISTLKMRQQFYMTRKPNLLTWMKKKSKKIKKSKINYLKIFNHRLQNKYKIFED
jgi:hypothetical protein